MLLYLIPGLLGLIVMEKGVRKGCRSVAVPECRSIGAARAGEGDSGARGGPPWDSGRINRGDLKMETLTLHLEDSGLQ